jgi:hypothetical protein
VGTGGDFCLILTCVDLSQGVTAELLNLEQISGHSTLWCWLGVGILTNGLSPFPIFQSNVVIESQSCPQLDKSFANAN